MAWLVKTFQRLALSKKQRWHVTKSNLRVKRPDPWHWANASPKAVADPAQNGRDIKSQRSLDLVRKPALQTPVQASQEASLNNSVTARRWTALL